ncbi:MAG TPA: hypothetical protein VNO50_03670 [Pyrinomonadaceae bacterium]|nr:hypothetical protein [Pyrinomonadaceae bacterium]
MKNGRIHLLFLATLVAITAAVVPSHVSAQDKLRPEEIVAKHLDSIAAAEMRASVKSRIAAGPVVAVLRAPGTAKYEGRGVLASDGNKNMMGVGFENAGQFQERFAFDGKDVTVGFARAGVRGYLGDFLLTHDNIIKEGLIGGTLSDSWPLLESSDKKPKLEYKGIKKSGAKSMHELRYTPKGGSDLEISLFFDTETFQHVRTEYTRVISAGLGTGRIASGRADRPTGAVDGSGQQRPTRYKMVEHFGDFKKESGMTLPRSYKVELEMDTRGGTFKGEWDFTLTDLAFNQKIPADTFNVGPKQ